MLLPALRRLGVEKRSLVALATCLGEDGTDGGADVPRSRRCAFVAADHPLRKVERAEADANAGGIRVERILGGLDRQQLLEQGERVLPVRCDECCKRERRQQDLRIAHRPRAWQHLARQGGRLLSAAAVEQHASLHRAGHDRRLPSRAVFELLRRLEDFVPTPQVEVHAHELRTVPRRLAAAAKDEVDALLVERECGLRTGHRPQPRGVVVVTDVRLLREAAFEGDAERLAKVLEAAEVAEAATCDAAELSATLDEVVETETGRELDPLRRPLESRFRARCDRLLARRERVGMSKLRAWLMALK